MKKIIILTILCAAVFFACKKQEPLTPQAAFDIYKKIIKAQGEYIDKNIKHATTFKQLNIDIPGGKLKQQQCESMCEGESRQCIYKDKYEFCLIDKPLGGYSIELETKDGSFSMRDYGYLKMKVTSITCEIITKEDENICKAFGGEKQPSPFKSKVEIGFGGKHFTSDEWKTYKIALD